MALVIAVLLSGMPAPATAQVAIAPITILAEEARPAPGYRKGKRLALRVVPVGWAEVELDTARAFARMHAAAARAGIELIIRSGFRSHEHQEWLYRAYRLGLGHLAAKPGYSNHQSGRAIDLMVDAEISAWLGQNARRYGFKRTVKGEPWHWEYTLRSRRR